MPFPFIHLHVHSAYSFLDGVLTPRALAQTAAAQGLEALALTDHHGLTGAIEFYDACREVNVRPLLGLELTVRPPRVWQPLGVCNVILLATDLRGWQSLCQLSSLVQNFPERDPNLGLSFEKFSARTAGLICLSGGKRGLAWRLIENSQRSSAQTFLSQLAELFPKNFYIELQQQIAADEAINKELAELANALSLPLVATNNVHYLAPTDAPLQRVVSAMQRNTTLAQLPATAPAPLGSYFTTAHEMQNRFASYPAAIANTREIAQRCQLELPLGVPQYPHVPHAVETLRTKSFAGAQKLYGELTPQISARLTHELDVITAKGYAPLFLIMEDILSHARQSGVPISSRGSAASSLVAHCLGLTSPDPLRLNLYFERFLNPARSTPPDIDTDLCSRRRDSVLRYVYQNYGADRVAMVCTINRFRERSALREVAKAYGLPPPEVKALVESLPYRGWGPQRDKTTSPFAELAAQYKTPTQQQIFRDAAALLGLPRHLSIHPGGIVIAPHELTALVPTHLASKGMVITQFDLDSIERVGLVKMDLLGIRGLTVLGDVAESATPELGATIGEVLESIPNEEALISEMIRHGRTIGCFQIESPGMRATLKEIKAQSIDDVMVALALYRPGPLAGGLKDSFVRRHLGQEAVNHLHPALSTLLGDTHGVILYQEQVLRLAHELAGLSLAEADLLRRAMSHFDPGKQMQTLKENFINGAQARSGVPPAVGERIWELMAAFAGYGFPKAHAASYAQVAWRAAWCKAHFPAQFMAAVLANWGGYYSQRVYLTEARRLKLKVQPPHINYSRREFSVTAGALYMGLDQVRDLTRRTQQRIIRERPFHSLNDFLSRVDPRPAEAESLISLGALEGFGLIPSLLKSLQAGGWERGQFALFEGLTVSADDWSLAEKVQAQEDFLGTSVIAHPLELHAPQIAASGALTTVGAASQVGQRVRVAGMRQTWRRSKTVRGDYIYFMSLEDLEGMLDVVIFGEVYRRSGISLAGAGPFVVEGILELDTAHSEPVIRAEKIWRVD